MYIVISCKVRDNDGGAQLSVFQQAIDETGDDARHARGEAYLMWIAMVTDG
jgi:hypothetical protein